MNLTVLISLLEELVRKHTYECICNNSVQALYKDIDKLLKTWVCFKYITKEPRFVIEINCETEKVNVHFTEAPEFRNIA